MTQILSVLKKFWKVCCDFSRHCNLFSGLVSSELWLLRQSQQLLSGSRREWRISWSAKWQKSAKYEWKGRRFDERMLVVTQGHLRICSNLTTFAKQRDVAIITRASIIKHRCLLSGRLASPDIRLCVRRFRFSRKLLVGTLSPTSLSGNRMNRARKVLRMCKYIYIYTSHHGINRYQNDLKCPELIQIAFKSKSFFGDWVALGDDSGLNTDIELLGTCTGKVQRDHPCSVHGVQRISSDHGACAEQFLVFLNLKQNACRCDTRKETRKPAYLHHFILSPFLHLDS